MTSKPDIVIDFAYNTTPPMPKITRRTSSGASKRICCIDRFLPGAAMAMQPDDATQYDGFDNTENDRLTTNYRRKAMVVNRLIMTIIIVLAAIAINNGIPAQADAETRYLKNNIHYQGRPDRGGRMTYRASYANYVDSGAGHEILPVNSEVEISVTSRGFRGRALLIVDGKTGRRIHFEYNERNMRIPMVEYIDLISSPKKTSLSNLSAKDQKGVKDGRAYTGMTKEGIRIALGYPAKHRTPSLDNLEWVYWIDRFRTTLVRFNTKGIVTEIR